MRKSFIVGISVLLLAFLSVQTVSAHHQQLVLGASDSSSLSIPPTSEGPGLILPDSPLFFLDQLKQNVRLLFAFSPEAKAKVQTAIAGERLAELRLMLIKNNKKGMDTALQGVANNLDDAAQSLSQAKLSGRNVEALAKQLNIDIKAKLTTLDELEREATGETKAKVGVATTSLETAKVKVEDALPEQELENEIRDDLNRRLNKRANEASESAREVEDEVNELHREASESAGSAIRAREEAIKKALEKRNEVLKRVEEKLLELEKEKQEKLLEAQKKASEQAREALKKAAEATQGLKRAQERINEIRNRTVGGTSEQSGSSSESVKSSGSSSGSSGSSGSSESSGSSGSGSSGSGSSGGGDSGKSGGDSGGKSGKD